MKLGRREKAILQEIAAIPSDIAISFLLSRGSVMRNYEIGLERRESRAIKRAEYHDLKQRRKKLLARLERKGLVTLVPNNEDVQVKLTTKGSAFVGVEALCNKDYAQDQNKWDGKWTLVMFDMPRDCAYLRQSLVRLLHRVGFKQVQMSNYIFPYEVPELKDFLLRNPELGIHCQVFRGDYLGDDSKLRKEFGLDK